MKNTGIVRRMDDLGRIVIPKEIRKTLRIKDGESLEIFLSNDNIVLKKYSPMELFSDFYSYYVESIYTEIGNNVLIVDRDQVVAFSGDLKKEYINMVISSELDNIINKRNMIFSKKKKKISFINGSYVEASFVVSPIITGSDVLGAVIIFCTNSDIDDFIIKTCIIAAKFLGKCIE